MLTAENSNIYKSNSISLNHLGVTKMEYINHKYKSIRNDIDKPVNFESDKSSKSDWFYKILEKLYENDQ